MEYRIEAAETEEEKEKERNFTGLGLTSRKNLCIHPDVWLRSWISPAIAQCSTGFEREKGGRCGCPVPGFNRRCDRSKRSS